MFRSNVLPPSCTLKLEVACSS